MQRPLLAGRGLWGDRVGMDAPRIARPGTLDVASSEHAAFSRAPESQGGGQRLR
jgi:hypothetical protein